MGEASKALVLSGDGSIFVYEESILTSIASSAFGAGAA